MSLLDRDIDVYAPRGILYYEERFQTRVGTMMYINGEVQGLGSWSKKEKRAITYQAKSTSPEKLSHIKKTNQKTFYGFFFSCSTQWKEKNSSAENKKFFH